VDADGFWLPVGALAEAARGLWSCYVAVPLDANARVAADGGATHRLEQRPLEVLETVSGRDGVGDLRAYVRGALDAGDLVVSEGLQRVVAGQRVRLQGAGPAGSDAQATAAAGLTAPKVAGPAAAADAAERSGS
jgi:hypothetical protein